MIYVDNAATTQMSLQAKEAMVNCINNYWGNPSSVHDIGNMVSQKLNEYRRMTASCLGCSPTEIYFTSGGSESDNQALISASINGLKQGKNHIISTTIEHHAILNTLDKLKEYGFNITLIPVNRGGFVNPNDIEKAITNKTCLVSVMYVNNEIGTIQPVDEIGAICRKYKIPFHTDAVQAVGHLPINLSKQPIDMLSLSAHKFHGAKGIGALYVKKGIKINSLINGGQQERGVRAGTENLPAIASMAIALQECCTGMFTNNQYVLTLRDYLIDNLIQINGVSLNGSCQNRICGNANFTFSGIDGESMLLYLNQYGICVSAGSACNSKSSKASHVLTAIGLSNEDAHSSIRFSLDVKNTKEEMDYIIQKIKDGIQLFSKNKKNFLKIT